jgi:hypothetical protein
MKFLEDRIAKDLAERPQIKEIIMDLSGVNDIDIIVTPIDRKTPQAAAISRVDDTKSLLDDNSQQKLYRGDVEWKTQTESMSNFKSTWINRRWGFPPLKQE